LIVADTSALIAALAGEAEGPTCRSVLKRDEEILVSAGTLAEAYIVAHHRGIEAELDDLLEAAGIEVIPVTEDFARTVGAVHARWEKGVHPAGLNFGDCFAYALAAIRSAPLLFIGKDFSKTDVLPAISTEET